MRHDRRCQAIGPGQGSHVLRVITPEALESGLVLLTQINLPECFLHLGGQQLEFIAFVERTRIRVGTVKTTHHLQCVNVVLVACTEPAHHQFSQGHGFLRYTVVLPSTESFDTADSVAEAMPIDLIRLHMGNPVLAQYASSRRPRHCITIRPGIDDQPRNLFQFGL
ncbi:hypothetical protein D3C80_1014540 [compost metagenome]